MTDLAAVQPSERWFDVHHPYTGEFIGLRICLQPDDTPEMKGLMRKIKAERRGMMRTGKKELPEDWEEEKGKEVLYTAITGWEWGADDAGEQLTFHGEVPEFNRENVKRVLGELGWLLKLVDREFGNKDAFFAS